jgi:hypothetical protein
MEKLLESMNELAEEGWSVVKVVPSFVVNVLVLLCMLPLFLVGWLKRLLTQRAGDNG